VNLDASGPEEIRAAFAAAIDTAGERSEEVAGVAGVLTEAADRYESLEMTASTVGHLRDASEAFAAARTSLDTAQEQLQAALADFATKDGAVGDAVADAGGNVASKEILLDGGGVATAAAAGLPAVTAAGPVDEVDVESGLLRLGPGDAPYLDWSCRRPEGGRLVELNDGTNAVVVDLVDEHLRDLVDQLGQTLGPDGDPEATVMYPDEDGTYLDWSMRNPDGTTLFEIGDGDGNAVNIVMTEPQMEALHDQLAADVAGDAELSMEVDDVLDAVDDETCFGSDQVVGVGSVPTNLLLMDYGDGGPMGDTLYSWSGGQYVEVVTPSGQPNSDYAAPALAPDEADEAAAHLDELAALAESGYRPPTLGRYAKARQHLAHLVDRDQAALDDRVVIGAEDQLPLTVRELLDLLHAQDPTSTTTRRRVTAQACSEAGGDIGALWMDLDTGDDGTTRIAVTAIEGDTSTPDEDFWRPYTAHHDVASARELAAKLRLFARAARDRPAGE
jgi:hypothetical protein